MYTVTMDNVAMLDYVSKSKAREDRQDTVRRISRLDYLIMATKKNKQAVKAQSAKVASAKVSPAPAPQKPVASIPKLLAMMLAKLQWPSHYGRYKILVQLFEAGQKGIARNVLASQFHRSSRLYSGEYLDWIVPRMCEQFAKAGLLFRIAEDTKHIFRLVALKATK